MCLNVSKMSQIEHVHDIIGTFSHEVRELEEDRKVAWRTVGACREELRRCVGDFTALYREIHQLQTNLKEVKIELEEAKGWKSFFRE